jgi:cytochrome oxidase Cu insertion factor (SCO1/SenC/PrrC family)
VVHVRPLIVTVCCVTIFSMPVSLGCAPGNTHDVTLDDLGSVGDFSFTDQDGHSLSRANLLGSVWVACFFFTRCGSVCPQISGTMAKLQKQLGNQEGVQLVSISVDPDFDTPIVLKEYARRFDADPKHWRFVTGQRDRVYELIRKSFLVAVEENQGAARTPGNEVTHSSRLALVDKRGRLRATFDGRQVDETGQPINDLARLQRGINVLLGEKP